MKKIAKKQLPDFPEKLRALLPENMNVMWVGDDTPHGGRLFFCGIGGRTFFVNVYPNDSGYEVYGQCKGNTHEEAAAFAILGQS